MAHSVSDGQSAAASPCRSRLSVCEDDVSRTPAASPLLTLEPVGSTLSLCSGSPGRHAGSHRLVRRLGSGSFGEVSLYEDVSDGGTYAVKRVPVTGEADWRSKRRESYNQQKFDDSSIVRVVDSWLEPTEDGTAELYIKQEFCEHGSVAEKYLPQPMGTRRYSRTKPPQRKADDAVLLTLLTQMLRALQKVHTQGMAHLDVKPANIFIASFEPLEFKLGDFGLSRQVEHGDLADGRACSMDSLQEGDGQYVPQDFLNDKSCPQAADIYALGMSMYEVALGRALPESGSPQHQALQRPGAMAAQLEGKCSAHLISIITRMTRPQSHARPTAAGLLAELERTYRMKRTAGHADPRPLPQKRRRSGTWATGTLLPPAAEPPAGAAEPPAAEPPAQSGSPAGLPALRRRRTVGPRQAPAVRA
eukprot:TRINITY_DN1315_c0_g1_i2.p1 TRINITY_DN1315_c0_g1~~TRINITY_DN1315_c0_g1_i2.p1  ORF type:complete len:418 (+),score=124.95 TRINITY_DN1315_c0_g1_i2:90-1343(+)